MRKLKSLYSKWGWIIRLIFVIAITCWLNFSVFTTIKISSKELSKIYISEENKTYIGVPQSFSLKRNELDAGNLGGALWRLIYFRSGVDKVCFEDKGSFLKYNGEIFYNKINSSVSYNGGVFFIVKDKECRNLPEKEDKFTFVWRFDVGMGKNYTLQITAKETMEESLDVGLTDCYQSFSGWICGNRIEIIPNIESYIETGWKSQIIKFIFLFLSTGALIWAWSRGIFWIRYGLIRNNP